MDVSVCLREWETQSPRTHPELTGVFLDNSNVVRDIADGLTNSQVLKITELKNGLSVESTSYVGRISLGNMVFLVLPKIDQMRLMKLMRYAYGLRNLRLVSKTVHSTGAQSFQDILIFQLVTETEEILSRGLIRKYMRANEDLTSPRGRPDMNRIAACQGLVGDKLPCIHYPRIEDCLLNQILLQGFKLAMKSTTDQELKAKLHQLSALFLDYVSEVELNLSLLMQAKRSINRLSAAYRPAVTIIELLYTSFGIILDETNGQVTAPGFLFDMNRFFQALLSRFLNENLIGYEVRDEYRLKGMMKYQPGYNPRRRQAPAARPDFCVLQHGQILSILDAKYRDLWANPLPRSMLYQLTIYALSQSKNRHAAILYPSVEAGYQEMKVQINDPVREMDCATVTLRPINLLHLEQLVSGGSQIARAEYAEWMAFGHLTIY